MVGLEGGDRRGLAAISSGNHGQALAPAASELDLRAVVVMPDTASPVKMAALWTGFRRGRNARSHPRPQGPGAD
ncbi:MAG: pyridoxal-phosphate dependent enzyme [Candidatus Dormibacteria bacterium]